MEEYAAELRNKINRMRKVIFKLIGCGLASMWFCASAFAQEVPENGVYSYEKAASDLKFYDADNTWDLKIPEVGVEDNADERFIANSFKVGLWQKMRSPRFLFDRDPYAYDFSGIAELRAWDTGSVSAVAGHSTLPGMLAMETGALVVTQRFGNVTLSGSVMAEKYRTFRGLDTNYGISGMLSYQINERFSLNLFGQYYRNSLYYSPAMLPYIGTSKYGVFADMQFGERFGMDLGVSREYDAYSRRWQTVPIAAPYVKLNNGAKIGLDVGRLLGVMIDEWVNDGRYYNSGNPTIGPPIPPMPPVR